MFSFFKQPNAFEKGLPLLGEMRNALANGQEREALAIYDRMPPEMQRSTAVMVLRAMAAEKVGEAEYQQAYEDFVKYHPRNSAIDLLGIDFHVNKKQFAEARRSIDRIDARVADPYLDFLRGSIFIMEKQWDEASQRVERAIEREPTLLPPYWVRMTIALERQDFAAARSGLLAIEFERGVPVGDLTTAPLYEPFVASPEFARWESERATRRAQAEASPAEK